MSHSAPSSSSTALEVASKIAKALTGAAIAATGALAAGYSDGELTRPEALVALGAALTALYGVWRVPNRDNLTNEDHADDPDTSDSSGVSD